MSSILENVYTYFKKRLAEILYMIAIPFYMVEISYLVMYKNSTSEDMVYLSPLFLGTVWVPAFLSYVFNKFLKKKLQSGKRKWIRNYPSVFIASYVLYFFILSRFEFGKTCLVASGAGAILLVFLGILKIARKQMFYLPPPKEFWFYVLTFLPPIVILFFTDVYFLAMKESPYFILMAPISYLPEIMGLFFYSIARSYVISKNKRPMTLFEAVFIMQIVNIGMALYFGAYWGEKIIWIALSISLITLMFADRFSKYQALSKF